MKNIFVKALNHIRTKGIRSFLYKSFIFVFSYIALIFAPIFWVLRIRVPVSSNMYRAMGHLAVEMDLYVKEGILGMRPAYRSILFVTEKKVINKCLLNYWRKYHLFIIDYEPLGLLLAKVLKLKSIGYDLDRYITTFDKGTAIAAIQNQYYPRGPVLELTDFDHARGWAALAALGISKDSWFVCVHARDGGNHKYQWAHNLRDVDINNYVVAMQEIVRRGGWVIRMGDMGMKTLPAMEKIIDYAHLDIKNDWMDIFLCASCKFFLGSSSGPVNVANVFGVSGIQTNVALPFSGILPYGSKDIGIPKLMWSLKDQRYLTFKEIFSSPLANYRFSNDILENSIRLDENSPEEIRDVTIEMLDRLEGKLEYTSEDECRQERFKALMNETHFSFGSMSRIGKDFLRKYEYLL